MCSTAGDGGSEFENHGRFKSTGRFEQETGARSRTPGQAPLLAETVV